MTDSDPNASNEITQGSKIFFKQKKRPTTKKKNTKYNSFNFTKMNYKKQFQSEKAIKKTLNHFKLTKWFQYRQKAIAKCRHLCVSTQTMSAHLRCVNI